MKNISSFEDVISFKVVTDGQCGAMTAFGSMEEYENKSLSLTATLFNPYETVCMKYQSPFSAQKK